MHYHAIPCITMQYHAILCNTLQYIAIPCNTMQYHASLITADGAYHCPVGSIWLFLAPSGALIAIPTYYWSSTHFFRSHWSSLKIGPQPYSTFWNICNWVVHKCNLCDFDRLKEEHVKIKYPSPAQMFKTSWREEARNWKRIGVRF